MPRSSILIIDPDQDSRTILSDYLEHAGYSVCSVSTGEEALETARSRRPDLIIGEHPILLSDGGLTCQALVEDPRTSRIPFVAVTSRVLEDELRGANRTHWAGVLMKPIVLGSLLDRVKSLTMAPSGSGPDDRR